MANDSNIKRFQVIEGGRDKKPKPVDTVALFSNTPDPYTKRHEGDAVLLTCPTCEHEDKIKTSLFIDAEQNPRVRGNTVEGSMKRRLCAHCLSKGRVTVV